MPTNDSRRPPGRRDGRRHPEGHARPMTTPFTKHSRVELKKATVATKKIVKSLHDRGELAEADAVQAVLNYAASAQDVLDFAVDMIKRLDLVPFAIPIPSDLHLRAYEGSPNLTADVLEGWVRFIAGEWIPERPVRAGHGEGEAKSVMNIRVPREVLKRVENAADVMVELRNWPTSRGWKLNARQIAVQWMARTYPVPAGDSEAAAE